MIDIHTHLLPAIDDGAADITQSLEMLKMARGQGVTHCVATPHAVIHAGEDIDKFLYSRQESYNSLKAVIGEDDSYPEILLGAEVFLDNDLSLYKEIEKLCIQNTNILLVEFPMFSTLKKQIPEWLFSLTLLGIQPVVVHIDRYYYFDEIMPELDYLNINYQINATRFLSFSGRRVLKRLFKYKYNYIVSSDMHNCDTRPCNMRKAFDIANKKYGKRLAEKMFTKNAQKLLDILD